MLKYPLVALLLSFLLPLSSALTQTTSSCPTNAVFLALEGEVRGYPLRSNGDTLPCQVLQGSSTTLSTARAVSFTADNSLHVMQFLTNGTVNVFAPESTGDVPPMKTEATFTNDLIAIATDSRSTDFVLSNR